MKNLKHIVKMTATAITVAFIFFSCKQKLSEADNINLASVPIQTVDSMYIVQTENGNIQMRVMAGVMERYENDTSLFEVFPKGVSVYSYKEDEVLESILKADNARHEKSKRTGKEVWKAFGKVVIKNIVQRETMETDTIYWDRQKQEIYTDCYVRMYSPSGFMQGYGMRSDEKVRNSIILRPFNTYGVVVKDSTDVIIDSVNFIGPLLKK